MSKGRKERFAHYLSQLLAERSGLAAERQEKFIFLIHRLVAVLEEGHSCLRVDEHEEMLLASCSLVCQVRNAAQWELEDLRQLEKPLVLFMGRLYLQRIFFYENRLARQLALLALQEQHVPELDNHLEKMSQTWHVEGLQLAAIRLAATRHLAVISGGPGTGKTTTAARIILLLSQLSGGTLKMALLAPTGKAAVRLQQSLQRAYGFLEEQGATGEEALYRDLPRQASTIHRALGMRKNGGQFLHGHENPLMQDVVLVDEASMVDLALMSKLVDSLKPGARLILLGDKDQLASVESGAVLADMICTLQQVSVVLQKTFRFAGVLGDLAHCVNRGQGQEALRCIEQDRSQDICLDETLFEARLIEGYAPYFQAVKERKNVPYLEIFSTFERFRILCATRVGPVGADRIDALVSHALQRQCGYYGVWYPGKTVMIASNSYGLGLFNGDIGICLEDEKGQLKVWFPGVENMENGLRPVLPSRLPEYSGGFAITIHKSQGSEFDHVSLVLPDQDMAGITRELLYTGITRSKKKVDIMSPRARFLSAIATKTERSSGLSEQLALFLHISVGAAKRE